jgi:DNA repair exonuclease SbcCD ATPase subunit
LPAVGKDLQDHIPLFKLRLIKKEDNAHLKLMSQLGVFQSQVELFRFAFPPNTSPDLDLPESLRDVYGDLKDIQDCLKSTPLDKARVARRIRQTLAFWGASYKEPLPSCLETVISRLQDLAGRLEGMQSSSSSEEKELTISEDGRDYLNKLDAAHSQATTKLEGYTKEQDEVQAQHTALTAEQQKADKEASELEEKARLARARARELLGETAELRKLSEACKRNIRVLEGRLEQIEEHQKIMKSHLVELQELAEEDPLAQHMAFILAYSLPSNL